MRTRQGEVWKKRKNSFALLNAMSEISQNDPGGYFSASSQGDSCGPACPDKLPWIALENVIHIFNVGRKTMDKETREFLGIIQNLWF